jgi:hypothetical protein
MDYPSLEAALGVIVFGPDTETLAGIQFAAVKLREAAALLEYRYAIGRRQEQQQAQDAGQLGPDTAQHGQQLAPAKRKRKHRTTRATNGIGEPITPPPPPHDPLFPDTQHAVE